MPSALCLEGSVVSVVWLQLLAAVHGEGGVPPATLAVSFLSVWLAYVGDRFLDARKPGELTRRHVLCRRYPQVVAISWLVVLAADLALALRFLPATAIASGLALLAVVVTYFLWLHNTRGASDKTRHREVLSDLAVGPLLALGLAWALSTGPGLSPGAVASLLGFALVASLNCRALTLWSTQRGQRRLYRALQATACAAFLVSAGLALVDSTASWTTALPAACLGLSAAAMASVHLHRQRLAADVRRFAVDAAMLSPLAATLTLALF